MSSWTSAPRKRIRLPLIAGFLVLSISLIHILGDQAQDTPWRTRIAASSQVALETSGLLWDSLFNKTSTNQIKPSRPVYPGTASGPYHSESHSEASSPVHTGQHEAIPTVSGCPVVKPNLILGSIDGGRWQDQIFIYMQSLDISLGLEAREHQSQGLCPPAPVEVKIIIPSALHKLLPPGFKSLMHRYPYLEFLGILPDMEEDIPSVIRRFIGWDNYATEHVSDYGKILIIDLDVIYQRSPFAVPVESGIDLLLFAEWRGLKIGQCSVHMRWLEDCSRLQTLDGGSYLSKDQMLSYTHHDRICAGSAFGTARGIKVFLNTMATELKASHYQCNDQGLLNHLYYSGIMQDELNRNDIGSVKLIPNTEALIGNIGTTPMVSFNEWGEIMNEKGDIFHAVHQYKTHGMLSGIVRNKYGWYAELERDYQIPQIPDLIESPGWMTVQSQNTSHAEHSHDKQRMQDEPTGHDLRNDVHDAHSFARVYLENATAATCSKTSNLCSCKYEDCGVHYDWY